MTMAPSMELAPASPISVSYYVHSAHVSYLSLPLSPSCVNMDACLDRWREKDGWSQTDVSAMTVVFFQPRQYQLLLISLGSLQ